MLKDNIQSILGEISNGNNLNEKITLVAATKTMPYEVINQAIQAGITVVAENRVQEFREKYDYIKGATHHFIGHLQTNKVKYLVGKVALIQSVDSQKLAEVISAEAQKKHVVQDILVEINIGGELSKSGFNPQNAVQAVKDISQLPAVRVIGLMAMLPKTDDQPLKESLCAKMRGIYELLKSEGLPFRHLSIGMSEDYKTAIRCGSNMIRLGSVIFGKRMV